MSNLAHLDAVLWIRIRSDPELFAGSIPPTNGSGSRKPNTIAYGSYGSGTLDFINRIRGEPELRAVHVAAAFIHDFDHEGAVAAPCNP
jgi:hypothetical protein